MEEKQLLDTEHCTLESKKITFLRNVNTRLIEVFITSGLCLCRTEFGAL